MEQGADICSGKLAGAAGSSQPRAYRGKLSTPEFLSLTSPFFLQIPPRSGREGLGCTKSKGAEQSQEEIGVSPKPGASEHPTGARHSLGVVGLCEENLGSHWGCAGAPDPEQTEIKGKAELGFREGPESAPLSEIFSECVQTIGEWWPWEVIPWNCAVPLCSSRCLEKHQQDLPVVLYPQVPLTESIHSP